MTESFVGRLLRKKPIEALVEPAGIAGNVVLVAPAGMEPEPLAAA